MISGEKTADRLRPARCLECKGVINAHSTYTFFCCRKCAARWGDDRALIQALAAREKQKKEKANPA